MKVINQLIEIEEKEREKTESKKEHIESERGKKKLKGSV